MKTRMLLVGLVGLIFLFAAAGLQVYADDYPQRVGYVNDFAGIFSPEEASALDGKLKDFHQTSRIEIIVITMPSLEAGKTASDYLQELSEDWKTGGRSILLLMAPKRERGGTAINLGSEIKQDFSPVIAWQTVYKDMFPGAMVGQANKGTVKAVERIIRYYLGKSL